MSSSRIVNLLIGLGIVVVLLLGWFLGVSPVLDQVSAANTQTQGLNSANAASSARLAMLKKQFENIVPLQKKLQKLQLSIPAEAEIPDFLAEINALCASAGVTLTSLTVNSALAYVAPGTVVPDATTGSTATPDATAPTVPVQAADPSTGLIAIPVKIAVAGPYAQVMAFAGALQKGTRLLFVTTLTLTASQTDSSFSAEIVGNIYALPLPQGVTQESITPKPTPTPTPSPTPTPAPTPTATPEPDATEEPAT